MVTFLTKLRYVSSDLPLFVRGGMQLRKNRRLPSFEEQLMMWYVGATRHSVLTKTDPRRVGKE